MPMSVADTHVYTGASWSENKEQLDTVWQQQTPTKSYLVFLRRADFVPEKGFRRHLNARLNIPEWFWDPLYQHHNGYFGCENIYDPHESLIGHSTWFRFQIKQVEEVSASGVKYVWHDLTFHTRWRAPDIHEILCFDIEDSFKLPILNALNNQPACRHAGVYMPHCAISSIVVNGYDKSVWTLRDPVRNIEQNRMRDVRPDVELLHELARHACHSSETLAVGVENMKRMGLECDAFGRSHSGTISHISTPLKQHLDFHTSLLQGLHERSLAVEARLRNEMNLKSNLVALDESRATVRLSRAARSDSAAMRAVAVVTLLFLPSTFVSTIFSMTFFSFDPGTDGASQHWAVSGMIWLYFLVTVPLTIIAMCSWIWWQRKHSQLGIV